MAAINSIHSPKDLTIDEIQKSCKEAEETVNKTIRLLETALPHAAPIDLSSPPPKTEPSPLDPAKALPPRKPSRQNYWVTPRPWLDASLCRQIRSLENESFSKLIASGHPLHYLLAVFDAPFLREKFEAEFADLPPADLHQKFTWNKFLDFYNESILSDSLAEKLFAAQREFIRSDAAPLFQLVKNHGMTQVSNAFSVEELTEKFNAECSGKTEKEILADINLEFLVSDLGKTVIGDRFKKLFSEGIVTAEKDGVTREFQISDTFYRIKEREESESFSSFTEMRSAMPLVKKEDALPRFRCPKRLFSWLFNLNLRINHQFIDPLKRRWRTH